MTHTPRQSGEGHSFAPPEAGSSQVNPEGGAAPFPTPDKEQQLQQQLGEADHQPGAAAPAVAGGT